MLLPVVERQARCAEHRATSRAVLAVGIADGGTAIAAPLRCVIPARVSCGIFDVDNFNDLALNRHYFRIVFRLVANEKAEACVITR